MTFLMLTAKIIILIAMIWAFFKFVPVNFQKVFAAIIIVGGGIALIIYGLYKGGVYRDY